MQDFEKKPTAREKILYTAAKLTSGDRDRSYGEPVGNMQDIARLWQAYLDCKRINNEGYIQLTGEDVAHMCSLMKMGRTFSTVLTPDTYIDSACYEAIAGECAEVERGDTDGE